MTAAWTATKTWSLGDIPSTAEFNSYLRDNLDHLAAPVGAQGRRTTNLSVATATWTPLTLPGENWDTDALHSTSSNTERFTIPTGMGGTFRVDALAAFATTGGSATFGMRVALNGIALVPTLFLQTLAAQSSGLSMCGTYYVQVVPTDYLQIDVYQSTGGNLNLTDALVTVMKASN